MTRRTALLLIIPAVLVLAAALATRARVLAAPAQPLPFSHRVHSESGIACLFCHSAALRADIAGMPSVQRCVGCHAVIAADRPAIQTLAGYWERGEPIPWSPVSLQPDFVFFAHSPHLGAGLNCETCHGDVGAMTATRPALRMDMGWCLQCHLAQPEEQVARLGDCVTCHK